MRFLILVFLVISLLSIGLFSVRFYQTLIQKQAVVVAETSDCKFEPFQEASTFFTLNEGETVLLALTRGDWVKVRRLDGNQGWIRLKDIEPL